MVKSSTDIAIQAEVQDMVFSLVDVYKLALELQYRGEDLYQFNYWLRQALGYLVLLSGEKEFTFPDIQINSYANIEDLRILTNSQIENLKRVIMAYENEIGDPLNQTLAATMLCLHQMRESCK